MKLEDLEILRAYINSPEFKLMWVLNDSNIAFEKMTKVINKSRMSPQKAFEMIQDKVEKNKTFEVISAIVEVSKSKPLKL